MELCYYILVLVMVKLNIICYQEDDDDDDSLQSAKMSVFQEQAHSPLRNSSNEKRLTGALQFTEFEEIRLSENK